MKNLKRVLSLVLALMMALSLMAFSSSASAADSTIPVASELAGYSDVDDAYKEAADVVVALGIIQGKDSGLDPDGNLTRAEAVIMIVRVLVGDAIAGLVSEDVFSDVPATFPGSESIAYAVNTGIVSGDAGSNKFFPSDELNVASFGKILLGALGYDTDKQGYTGTMWAVNVFRDMRTAGISLDGVTNPFATLTRQQAMQMVFQTLKADMVEYVNGSNTPTKVVNNATDYTNNNAKPTSSDDTIQQFCEFYYPKLTLAATSGTDSFGRSTSAWKLDSSTICETASSGATYTYTSKNDASKDALTSVLNGVDVSSVVVWINGKADAAADMTNAATAADTINGYAGNGRLIELYVVDGALTKIVIVDSFLAVVDRVNESSKQVVYKVLASEAGTVSADRSLTSDVGYGSYEVGDYVVVTATMDSSTLTANAKIQEVYPATAVTGFATAVNGTKKTLTVDGTTYTAAYQISNANKIDKDFGVSAVNEATLYLDQYGYVLYAKEGEVTSVSDYIIAVTDVASVLEGNRVVTQITGVLSNGETITITQKSGDSEEPQPGEIWQYDATGDFTLLTGLTTSDADIGINDKTFTIKEGTASGAGAENVPAGALRYTLTTTGGSNDFYFSSDVKFIFIDENGTATVLDGVQAFTLTSGQKATFVVNTVASPSDTRMVKAVFVEGTAPTDTTSTDDIIFVVGGSTSSIVVADSASSSGYATCYTYDAYLNGAKIQNFYSEDNIAKNTDKFYRSIVKTSNGSYDLRTPYDGSGEAQIVDSATSVTDVVSTVAMEADGQIYAISGAHVVAIANNAPSSVEELATAFANGDSISVKILYTVVGGNRIADSIFVTSYTAANTAVVTDATVTVSLADTSTGGGKVAATAEVDVTSSTIDVTLKSGGLTVADNDTVVITLTTEGTSVEVDESDGSVDYVTIGNKTVTVKKASSTWTDFDIIVTNGDDTATYTVTVTEASETIDTAQTSTVTYTASSGSGSLTSSAATVGSVSNGAADITISTVGVTAGANDTLTVTVTVAGTGVTVQGGATGATSKTVTLTYDNGAWNTDTVVAVAPAGNTVTYTVKTQ